MYIIWTHRYAKTPEKLFEMGSSKETAEKVKNEELETDLDFFICFDHIRDLYFRGWLDGFIDVWERVWKKLFIDSHKRQYQVERTNHAKIRCQQRGIKNNHVDLILKHGTPIRRPGNVMEYRLYKRDKARIIETLKKDIQSMDKCTSKAVLVDAKTEEIITVYNAL